VRTGAAHPGVSHVSATALRTGRVELRSNLGDAWRGSVYTCAPVLHTQLPLPEEASAAAYRGAYRRNEIIGRCVRLGYDEHNKRQQHYHWAIRQRGDALEVHDFWDLRHWTTTMYRQAFG
jgi:hypothetical protein